MKKQKTTILQMFYGQRGKSDKVNCAPEYKEYSDKAEEYYKALCKKFEDIPEGLELLTQFIEWTNRTYALEIDAYYSEGFKFGLLIGVEAGESKFE